MDVSGPFQELASVGLAAHWGVSKSTASYWVGRPGFPEPITYRGQSGRVKLWFVGEADAFRNGRG